MKVSIIENNVTNKKMDNSLFYNKIHHKCRKKIEKGNLPNKLQRDYQIKATQKETLKNAVHSYFSTD
jgi:hypothetical protein